MPLRFARRFVALTKTRYSIPRRSFATGPLTAAGTLLAEPLLPHIAPSLAPLIVALLLLHAHSDSDEGQEAFTEDLPLSRNVPYYVRELKEAGRAAFAARDMRKGEVVITDSPLLIWPQGMTPEEAEDLYAQLTPRAREVFDGLVNSMDAKKGLGEVLGRRATNGFAVSVPEVPEEAKAANDLSAAKRVSFLYPKCVRSYPFSGRSCADKTNSIARSELVAPASMACRLDVPPQSITPAYRMPTTRFSGAPVTTTCLLRILTARTGPTSA